MSSFRMASLTWGGRGREWVMGTQSKGLSARHKFNPNCFTTGAKAVAVAIVTAFARPLATPPLQCLTPRKWESVQPSTKTRKEIGHLELITPKTTKCCGLWKANIYIKPFSLFKYKNMFLCLNYKMWNIKQCLVNNIFIIHGKQHQLKS